MSKNQERCLVTHNLFKDVIEDIKQTKLVYKMHQKKKIEYYNVPCSFDIETSSFYQGENKQAIMYCWQMCFRLDDVIMGRTYQEFFNVLDYLVDALELNIQKRLVIYVHNLSYEFQFIRKYFEWSQVFALDERKVCRAVTTNGIEFRCSYILSSLSLAKVGESLRKYTLEKMVGDLDYSLIRHHDTPLTDKEIGYCINDVRIINHYIQEKIESGESISKIPLTNTGYVREYCRKHCLQIGSKRNYNYINIMKRLTLTTEEYTLLKAAFSGGFTHANALHSGELIHNVKSYDFTSSYPAVMLAEKYPMGKGRLIDHPTRKAFFHLLQYYCCVFRIKFYNLKPKPCVYENYISRSKCFELKNFIENNGRIVQAEVLATTITNVDFEIINQFYDYEDFVVKDFYYYKKNYLPKEFVECILKFYEDKTTLKGVDEKEDEYLKGKGMLNSCYGMAVTDISRPNIIYEDDWSIEMNNLEETIEKENNKFSRFLFYPWGIFVTAYARRNLFTGIKEFGSDLIYVDTDSLKVINHQNHLSYIENYNKDIENKLRLAMDYHGIDFSRCKPKTIKGVEKLIGVWDDDGMYERFKTLGAKRYMVEVDGKLNLTISGVNKKVAVPYLIRKNGFKKFEYKLTRTIKCKKVKKKSSYYYYTKEQLQMIDSKIFESFVNEMVFPSESTGKQTHTYLDNEQSGKVKDYLGNETNYHEQSSVHMEGCEYSLTLSDSYLDYIRMLQGVLQ